MISFPNAKINIGLHVINKRADGFHNIESVFYPIRFCDGLEVMVSRTNRKQNKCQLISQGLQISGKLTDNLIIKAYHLLDVDFNLPPTMVYLNKRIPMGAGLGGGSSDGANALKLFNECFKIKLTQTQLESYAALLGSDCAFFIRNKPSYLFGKGDELQDTKFSLAGYYLILLHDGSHSNTA
jgi:4-diphosphocytidyl-2-C-methyl-D-erythritol kinase